MQSNLELMQEKLSALKRALILETDAAAKFKLSKEIDELQQQIENYQEIPIPIDRNKKVFNVPIPRNPYFTGRGDILAKLHEALQTEKATALSGLGE